VHSNRYATASARSDGMLLLCGGRDASGMVTIPFFPFMSGYSSNRVRPSFSVVNHMQNHNYFSNQKKKSMMNLANKDGRLQIMHLFSFSAAVRCIWAVNAYKWSVGMDSCPWSFSFS
jgi:hypothetical protein